MTGVAVTATARRTPSHTIIRFIAVLSTDISTNAASRSAPATPGRYERWGVGAISRPPCCSSPQPACRRDVEHDAVGAAVLHLDVAVGLMAAHAERLVAVVAAWRAGGGQLVGDRLQALHPK